jgi:flavorubredoxin
MSACTNAQLVCNWAMVERHTNCFDFPLERCRWVMHEESFDIGDRSLHALRPPLYDSPTTRGIFDSKTGVYWSVDTFAAPLPDPHAGIADLDPEFWDFGMTLFAYGALCPWLSLLDSEKFGRYVDGIQGLDIKTIAGCHTPVIEGPHIAQAFDHVRKLPSVEPPPLPDQSILDQIIAATSEPQA